MPEDVSQNLKGQAINGGYLSGLEREPSGFIVEYPTGFHMGAPT